MCFREALCLLKTNKRVFDLVLIRKGSIPIIPDRSLWRKATTIELIRISNTRTGNQVGDFSASTLGVKDFVQSFVLVTQETNFEKW